MLIRMTPEKIAEFWAILKPAIAESLPPIAAQAESTMFNMLTRMVSAEMQCWVSVRDNTIIDGVVVTGVAEDFFSGSLSLLIYAFYSSRMGKESWLEGVETLKKYARGKGCTMLSAYSANPMVARMA